MDENEILTEPKQYIVVKLDQEQSGIDISFIDNIVRMERITRVPKVQSFFPGVINLRGEIIPVMSLRNRFGLKESASASISRLIKEAVEKKLIKPLDSTTAPRYMKYVPYWA